MPAELLLLRGPAGAGKSQRARAMLAAGEVDALADFTAIYAAVTGAERGADGKYPERPSTDPRIPATAYLKTAAARVFLRRGFRALVTTSDSSEQETARWRAVADGEGARFDVETVDPGRDVVAARLSDPATGELSAECATALGRWYRDA